ncbi:DNA-3-methyladenine glycosylase I [Tahibacter caeni]|uniref:DNA-3-methyladenine glycosylase I n=1 Tax=Tahibacter caeni TaxID=1453545 RepID=UPI002148F870|nr:DNA-3-methyladenine glycosylase I [Tahibacter caeni]
MSEALKRCFWAESSDSERAYHDAEWGRPLHGDQALFEFLCLEGAQAGLSWRTVLEKRENYRRVFHGFDVARCAALSDAELERALTDPGIVRNRLKVHAVRRNALAAQAVQKLHGSLDAYLWSFVDGRPVDNRPRGRGDVPASTPLSDRLSKALRKQGFTFVGTTICYAFLQATGMVNDHLIDCFCRDKSTI